MAIWRRFLLLLILGSAFAAPLSARETLPMFMGNIGSAEMPPEARHTLALIKQGGPFPYAKDGAIFGNFERRLPPQRRGYYREYTVDTPGRRDRGPRRIIAGGNPLPREFYYTSDHYRTFRRIQE